MTWPRQERHPVNHKANLTWRQGTKSSRCMRISFWRSTTVTWPRNPYKGLRNPWPQPPLPTGWPSEVWKVTLGAAPAGNNKISSQPQQETRNAHISGLVAASYTMFGVWTFSVWNVPRWMHTVFHIIGLSYQCTSFNNVQVGWFMTLPIQNFYLGPRFFLTLFAPGDGKSVLKNLLVQNLTLEKNAFTL